LTYTATLEPTQAETEAEYISDDDDDPFARAAKLDQLALERDLAKANPFTRAKFNAAQKRRRTLPYATRWRIPSTLEDWGAS